PATELNLFCCAFVCKPGIAQGVGVGVTVKSERREEEGIKGDREKKRDREREQQAAEKERGSLPLSCGFVSRVRRLRLGAQQREEEKRRVCFWKVEEAICSSSLDVIDKTKEQRDGRGQGGRRRGEEKDMMRGNEGEGQTSAEDLENNGSLLEDTPESERGGISPWGMAGWLVLAAAEIRSTLRMFATTFPKTPFRAISHQQSWTKWEEEGTGETQQQRNHREEEKRKDGGGGGLLGGCQRLKLQPHLASSKGRRKEWGVDKPGQQEIVNKDLVSGVEDLGQRRTHGGSVIQFHSLIPISWKNLTMTVAVLGALMCLSTSVVFPWIIMNHQELCPRSVAAAVVSCLTFLAYSSESYVLRTQAHEQRGYMGSIPGLLKLLQLWGGCQMIPLVVEKPPEHYGHVKPDSSAGRSKSQAGLNGTEDTRTDGKDR
ncbi:hypothetical protein INR49_007157, partial [Caranx melampygus]